MRKAEISNLTHPIKSTLSVDICESLYSRFMGLMFRRHLAPGSGILMIEKYDSRVNSAIHMLFMRFNIAVIWINSAFSVVDVRLARRWSPALISSIPARFILEIHPSRISEFQIGDQITFSDV